MDRLLQKYRDFTLRYRVFGMSWEMIWSLTWVVLALALALFFPASPWKWLCFAAMAVSHIGDILLTPDTIFHKWFFCDMLPLGGSFFAVAHVLYAIAFSKKAVAFGGIDPLCFLFGGLLFLLAACALLWQNHLNPERNTLLCLAIIFYAGVICLNASMIFAAALSAGTFGAWLSVFGILNFYVSDAILLCGAVGPKKVKFYDEWVWIFYPIGQLALLIGA